MKKLSVKIKQKSVKEKKKLRNTLIKWVITAFVVISLYILYYFGQAIIDILKDLARNFDTLLVVSLSLFSFFLVFIYFNILRPALTHFNDLWVKYYWRLHTIYVAFCIFILGAIFITFTFGKPQLSLFLRDSTTGDKIGNITCEDHYNIGRFIAGNEINCDYAPKLTNMSGNVSFILSNGANKVQMISDPIVFNSATDVERITFNIYGLDEHNQNKSFVTSNNFKFLTVDEEEKRNDTFITYFLALLGIILFSVPPLMATWKTLDNNEKEA